MRTPRVYCYVRGSTNEQVLTIEAQTDQTGKVAEVIWAPRGFICVKQPLVDSGVTGGIVLADRPAGRVLCSLLEPGDCVIVSKMDRAFRDAADTALQIKIWSEQGIILHALDCGLDTSTPVGRCVAQIMGVIAEMERHRISERLRESRAVMKRQGRVASGSKPWGMVSQVMPQDGKQYWVIDREERTIMGLIVRLHDKQGLSFLDIVDYLNTNRLIPAARTRKVFKRNRGRVWKWTNSKVYDAYLSELRLMKRAASAGSSSSPATASSPSPVTPSPSPNGERQNSNS